jgi:integrase
MTKPNYRAPYRTGEKALSRKEADAVVLAAKTLEDRILVLIGFTLGLRREDLVSILISNIDLVNGTLSYVEKKKKNRIRTVPMSDRLLQELKIYLTETTMIRNDDGTFRKILKNIQPGQEYLFPAQQKTSCGAHMSDKTAYNRYNDLCKTVGIPTPVPIHSMRSTCIKLKEAEGWTAVQTAELIGDKVATVLDHYATPTRAEIADMMKNRSGI